MQRCLASGLSKKARSIKSGKTLAKLEGERTGIILLRVHRYFHDVPNRSQGFMESLFCDIRIESAKINRSAINIILIEKTFLWSQSIIRRLSFIEFKDLHAVLGIIFARLMRCGQ